MAELIVLGTVVALVGLVVVAVRATGGRRTPHDQPEVTDTRPVPPPDPDRPVPGSRPHREAHGKP